MQRLPLVRLNHCMQPAVAKLPNHRDLGYSPASPGKDRQPTRRRAAPSTGHRRFPNPGPASIAALGLGGSQAILGHPGLLQQKNIGVQGLNPKLHGRPRVDVRGHQGKCWPPTRVHRPDPRGPTPITSAQDHPTTNTPAAAPVQDGQHNATFPCRPGPPTGLHRPQPHTAARAPGRQARAPFLGSRQAFRHRRRR